MKKLDEFVYTDYSTARVWNEKFGERFHLCSELGDWYMFNGMCWGHDLHGRVVKETLPPIMSYFESESDLLGSEIELLGRKLEIYSKKALDKIERKTADEHKLLSLYIKRLECTRWIKSIQSKSRFEAILGMAASLGASKSYSEYDSKGYYLGVKNGAINLKTGEFVTNDPAYLITKQVTADYKKGEECPNFVSFLNLIFDGDQEIISYLQRLAGESLIGEDCKQYLHLFVGSGANGKSTYVDTLQNLLGGYAITTSPDAITVSGSSNDYHLATMKGARLTVINESRANAKLDNQMVKRLVDSGPVQARQIYGKPFVFQPVATPILVTNNPPILNSDYALARRLLCVNFNYQIPEGSRDPRFIKKYLQPEMSGILNWALEGCREYMDSGLNPPDSIKQATREYIYEYDRTLKFVTTNFDKDHSSKILAQDFYRIYCAWCNEQDTDILSSKMLYKEIRAQGYKIECSTGNVNYVFGLKSLTTSTIKNPSIATKTKLPRVIEECLMSVV